LTVWSNKIRKLKILEEAKKLFVEFGFSGTSVAHIARNAGVSHSLIFHYFENKETLWRTVKNHFVETYKTKHQDLIPSLTNRFEDFIDQLFKNCIAFYIANPNLMKILHWQRLEADQNKMLSLTTREVVKCTISFRYYKDQGDLRGEVYEDFCMTYLLSLAFFNNIYPFLKNDENREVYIQFCIVSMLKVFE